MSDDPSFSPTNDSSRLAVCRDCLNEIEQGGRCSVCASPRVLYHPERLDVGVAHIDCDAFFAAIEKRDNPALLDKPVIIGGGKRGVVATACYIARSYGVHSAMPMFKALKACPHGVVISSNFAKYTQAAREFRTELFKLSPLVEPASIDEAYIDLNGTRRLHNLEPARVLMRFALDIEKKIGITVSVGLSVNKFLAKVASEFDKPRGFKIIGAREAKQFLCDKSVAIIPGVGKKMQNLLNHAGIYAIGHLQSITDHELIRRYGKLGLMLAQRAQGYDPRPVQASREVKSISNETTFIADITSQKELRHKLYGLSHKVADRLKDKHLAGKIILLKLKSSNFQVTTRRIMLKNPTCDSDSIFNYGCKMLAGQADGIRAFRLIGVGVGGIVNPDQGQRQLFERGKIPVSKELLDDLADKFGRSMVQKGSSLVIKQKYD